MKFSFYLPCYWPDTSYPAQKMYRDMVEQAKLAETLDFKSVGIPEHHFINYLTHPSPLMSAVKVASATERIRIVISVLVLPFMDMRRVAGEIAQADCLTDGRLDVGVGRGAFRYEFDRFGVKPEDSRALMDESLDLLKRLLTEYEVSCDTNLYKFDALSITPRPVQKPHPPLWIAAVTPTAIYHSVLKGYHVMTTPLRESLDAAMEQIDAFHKGMAEVGPAAKDRKFSMLRMLYVAKDKADAREKLEIANANDQRFHNIYTTPGTVENGAIAPIETNRTLAEVNDNLVIGSADECIEKLTPYAERGLLDFLANMSFGASSRDVMGSMERFARDVMPHFGA